MSGDAGCPARTRALRFRALSAPRTRSGGEICERSKARWRFPARRKQDDPPDSHFEPAFAPFVRSPRHGRVLSSMYVERLRHMQFAQRWAIFWVLT